MTASNIPAYPSAFVDRQTPEEMWAEAQRILSGAEPVPDFTLSDEPEPEATTAAELATVARISAAADAEAKAAHEAAAAREAARVRELTDWHALHHGED
jgi:hypothetical protein